MRLLIAGCVKKSLEAASENELVSATLMKVSSSAMSIIPINYPKYEKYEFELFKPKF
jgi:hypothetical protein